MDNFRKDLKKIAAGLAPIKKYVSDEYVEDGKAVVYVRCDGSQAFSPFSVGRQSTISADVTDYIDGKTDLIPVSYPMIFRFVGTFSEQEKASIREAVNEHYTLVLQSKKWDLRSNTFKICGLCAGGVLFTALGVLFGKLSLPDWLNEVTSILATVALWEAADMFLLERSEIKGQMLSAAQSVAAEVEFVSESDLPSEVSDKGKID